MLDAVSLISKCFFLFSPLFIKHHDFNWFSQNLKSLPVCSKLFFKHVIVYFDYQAVGSRIKQEPFLWGNLLAHCKIGLIEGKRLFPQTVWHFFNAVKIFQEKYIVFLPAEAFWQAVYLSCCWYHCYLHPFLVSQYHFFRFPAWTKDKQFSRSHSSFQTKLEFLRHGPLWTEQ